MSPTDILSSPGVVALITGAVSIVSAYIGAKLQRFHGKELERDRFRHDIAASTTKARLDVHIRLAGKVTKAYRAKFMMDSDYKDFVNDAKNFFYDNIFFYSPVLGSAFREIAKSLTVEPASKSVAEVNLNAFTTAIRKDLMLEELASSVGRAVTKKEKHEDSTHP